MSGDKFSISLDMIGINFIFHRCSQSISFYLCTLASKVIVAFLALLVLGLVISCVTFVQVVSCIPHADMLLRKNIDM